MTPQETDPDLPGSVQESLAKVWVSGLLLGQEDSLEKKMATHSSTLA